ncbi:hypothetical protein, partial [Eikenella halliae]|uniref:hypothetical protein n=1 Tax=Eikenella halliae TaxID=1795832 RepID=UPI003609EC25
MYAKKVLALACIAVLVSGCKEDEKNRHNNHSAGFTSGGYSRDANISVPNGPQSEAQPQPQPQPQ